MCSSARDRLRADGFRGPGGGRGGGMGAEAQDMPYVA